MKAILIALLMLPASAAAQQRTDAAPKLPEIFHGQWCGEAHWMERCGERDGLVITAAGFEQDEIGCRLSGLTPQKPSRRESEYRATFRCMVGADRKSRQRQYLIGFNDESHRSMFLLERKP